MKQSLHPGISKVKRIVVDRDRTISFMGEDGRVYGTPELGRDIEHACRDILLEYADPGEIRSVSKSRYGIPHRRYQAWPLRSPRW